jgi:hypothetical protein
MLAGVGFIHINARPINMVFENMAFIFITLQDIDIPKYSTK